MPIFRWHYMRLRKDGKRTMNNNLMTLDLKTSQMIFDDLSEIGGNEIEYSDFLAIFCKKLDMKPDKVINPTVKITNINSDNIQECLLIISSYFLNSKNQQKEMNVDLNTRLWIGFALNEGLWKELAWCTENGITVDPMTKHTAYYGVCLNETQTLNFIRMFMDAYYPK